MSASNQSWRVWGKAHLWLELHTESLSCSHGPPCLPDRVTRWHVEATLLNTASFCFKEDS